jgi:hypothetical protein
LVEKSICLVIMVKTTRKIGINILFLILVSSLTFAYTPLSLKQGIFHNWGQEQVTYYLNEQGSDDISFLTMEDIIIDSFRAWEEASNTSLNVQYLNKTDKSFGFDKQNTLVFVEENFPGPSQVIATTLLWVENGKLVDSDIVFNGEHHTFSRDDSAKDLQSVATHEIGHLLGLDHSTLGKGNDDFSAYDANIPTMHPYALPGMSARYIEPDDIAGISSLYSGRNFSNLLGSVGGMVTFSSGHPVTGASIVLTSTKSGKHKYAAVSGAKQRDGRYLIEGVPPGDYVLGVAPLNGWNFVKESNLGGGYHTFDTAFDKTYYPTNTSEFTNDLVVRLRAGNNQDWYHVVVQNKPPLLALESPQGGISHNTTVLNWSLDDNELDDVLCNLTLDNATLVTDHVSVLMDGGYNTYDVHNLSEGQHSWGVACTDLGYNTVQNTTDFTVNTQPPMVVFASSPYKRWPRITINYFIEHFVSPQYFTSYVDGKLYVSNHSVTANVNHSLMLPSNMEEGHHALTLEINYSSELFNYTFPFIFDTTKPNITLHNTPNDYGCGPFDEECLDGGECRGPDCDFDDGECHGEHCDDPHGGDEGGCHGPDCDNRSECQGEHCGDGGNHTGGNNTPRNFSITENDKGNRTECQGPDCGPRDGECPGRRCDEEDRSYDSARHTDRVDHVFTGVVQDVLSANFSCFLNLSSREQFHRINLPFTAYNNVSFAVQGNLSNGTYDWGVQCTDLAGNLAETEHYELIVATGHPIISLNNTHMPTNRFFRFPLQASFNQIVNVTYAINDLPSQKLCTNCMQYNRQIELFLYGNITLTVTARNAQGLQTQVQKNLAVYLDTDEDGIPDHEDFDADNDGINDAEDTVIGGRDYLKQFIGDRVKLFINQSENFTNPQGMLPVRLKEVNKTIFFFDYNFSARPFKLSGFNVFDSPEGKGGMIVTGLNLTNTTKTFFIDRVDASLDGMCIKDEEMYSFDQITADCTGSNEVLLACDGVSVQGYACTYNATSEQYIITGLKHSGVVQMEAPSSGGDSNSGSHNNGNAGSGGSQGAGSSGGGSTPTQSQSPALSQPAKSPNSQTSRPQVTSLPIQRTTQQEAPQQESSPDNSLVEVTGKAAYDKGNTKGWFFGLILSVWAVALVYVFMRGKQREGDDRILNKIKRKFQERKEKLKFKIKLNQKERNFNKKF